jgi:hypothetical protein
MMAMADRPADSKQALDTFVSMAYTCPELMKFIRVAVDTFERRGTAKLTLHVKDGAPKGGDGTFSF